MKYFATKLLAYTDNQIKEAIKGGALIEIKNEVERHG